LTPTQLDVRASGDASIRVTLKPVSLHGEFPDQPAIAEWKYRAPALSLRERARPVHRKVGNLSVEVRQNPLTIVVRNAAGQLIQEVTFADDGSLSFTLDEHPVLGMGEGGPRPQKGPSTGSGQGANWREQPVQFDRRGALDTMEPRWQSDMYGSRNPVAMLLGTGGWGLFVATPWGQVDLRDPKRGVFLPFKPTGMESAPQTERNQQQALGKGIPPIADLVTGLFDFFVFDARDPVRALKDFSAITGPAVMPPKWALGYMQSHRTLEDAKQMIGIVDTFRSKRIPLDAVIYLGTGFSPRGWNTRQPSFDFNPDVFTRDPTSVLAMHARNVKVVVHMVPWDRDASPPG
jgi:alpha-glucosidase/alpha-D-xyloside xylohydrolase